jgi:release factor glutamine methyltransferase
MADPTIGDHDGVYFPREDSYLLAEVVKSLARGKVLDLGTGSGIQGITAALKGCDVTFADIDPKAVAAAKQNAKGNGVTGRFVVSDLFARVEGRFDTIVFNPPYLPSSKKIVASLDGGIKGRELIDRFLEGYKGHLEPNGVALLLESSLNGYEKEVRVGAKVIKRAHYFFEDLVVLELR